MTSGTETVRILVEHNRNEGRVTEGDELVVSNKEARELETMGWAINVEKADLGDIAAANLIEANAEEQSLAREEEEARAQEDSDRKDSVLGSSSSHYTGEVDTFGRVKSFEDAKASSDASAKEDDSKASSASSGSKKKS